MWCGGAIYDVCEGQRTTSAVGPFLLPWLRRGHLVVTLYPRLAGPWAPGGLSRLHCPSHQWLQAFVLHICLGSDLQSQVPAFTPWAMSSVLGLPSPVEDLRSRWDVSSVPSSSPEVDGFHEEGQRRSLKRWGLFDEQRYGSDWSQFLQRMTQANYFKPHEDAALWSLSNPLFAGAEVQGRSLFATP